MRFGDCRLSRSNATTGWEPWEPPGVPFGGPRKLVSLRFARRDFAPECFRRQWQIARLPTRCRFENNIWLASAFHEGGVIFFTQAPPRHRQQALPSRLKRRAAVGTGDSRARSPPAPPQRDQPDRVRLIPKRKPAFAPRMELAENWSCLTGRESGHLQGPVIRESADAAEIWFQRPGSSPTFKFNCTAGPCRRSCSRP